MSPNLNARTFGAKIPDFCMFFPGLLQVFVRTSACFFPDSCKFLSGLLHVFSWTSVYLRLCVWP